MESVSALLMVFVGLFAAAAVGLLVVGISNAIEPFVVEVKEESAGLGAAGNVMVRRLGFINRQLIWPSYEERTRRKLIKGGEPQGYRPPDILALQEVGFLAGLLVGLWACASLEVSYLFATLPVALGTFYPLIWLDDQVKKRHLLINRALPFNLDLLTLSVEAGLDFTAALAKVVEKGKPGPLREELQLVLKQLKMGKPREEALRSLINRIDLPALSQFVTTLIQADRMGTSLGKVLRIQSTQLRIDRTHRAEKMAGEAPVKMLFPLVACIFPTVFMILFGPIVFALRYGNLGE